MNNFEKPPQSSDVEDVAVQEELKRIAIKLADRSLSENKTYKSGSLSEKDFDYIKKVEELAEKNLQDPEYVKSLTDDIKKGMKKTGSSGITPIDELYDPTIMKNYNHDKYGKDNKAA